MKLVRIVTPKHPGDIFFKIQGSKDDFICKFYKGHEEYAQRFQEWLEGDVNGLPRGSQARS